MVTLENAYKSLCDKNTKTNCYYYENSDILSFEIGKDQAQSFIKKYFEIGGKKCLFSVGDLTKLSSRRCEHMCSLFLLGIYVYDNVNKIREAIDKYTKYLEDNCTKQDSNAKKNSEPRKRFLYMWYLICLYHDLGYLYEIPDNGEMPQDFEELDGLTKQILSSTKGSYGIPKKIRENALLYYTLHSKNIFFRENRHIDHGIIGGIKLYSILKDQHSSDTIDEDGKSGLFFGKPIFDYFIVPIAWTIISHNIWTAFLDGKEAKKYSLFGLDGLICEKGTPLIKLAKHPLLFLLSFLDTIEPIKIFERCDILSQIKIDAHASSFTLCIENITLPCRYQCMFYKHTNTCSLFYCYHILYDKLKFLYSPSFNLDLSKSGISFNFR